MQQPHVFRLSIYSTVPPLTDPRIVLQRADEVNTVLRMLSDAQTSTVVLTGDPGAGKSTLAALLYRRVEAAVQAGQAPFRRFVWLSLGPNATLPDVIAAILFSIGVTGRGRAGGSVTGGAGASIGMTGGGDRAGANRAIDESFTGGGRAGASPAPTIYERFADFFVLKPDEQIAVLVRALSRPHESAFVVLDQFEELFDLDSSQGLVGRGAIPLFLDMLQKDFGASRVLLTSRRSPYNGRNGENMRVRTNLVSRISIPEGVALLQQRGVQGIPEELSLIWQRCAGHVFGLVLFSTLCSLSGLSLSYLLNSPDYQPMWNGEVTLNLVGMVYNLLNPMQRVLLRALCLFSEPVLLEGVVIAVTGEGEDVTVDVAMFERELAILTGLSLVQVLSQEGDRPNYLLHPLLRQYVTEHYVEGFDRHPGVDLTIALGVTDEPNPMLGNPEAREIAVAAGHIRVAVYYSRLAQENCPPREKRSGPQDVEPLLAMVHHLCLGWHWQQAYDLLSYEELHESMMQWGAWNTLIRLYTAMVPPLGVVTRYDEGQIFSQLGVLYGCLGDYQQSRFYFEQALETQREIGDEQGEAVTLTNQGEVLRSEGKTEQARANFEQALMLSKQQYDANLESVVLHNLGLLYQNKKDYPQALSNYLESLRLARSLQEYSNTGVILTNIGILFYEQGRLPEALALLLSALQLRQSVQDRTVGALVRFLDALEHKMGPETFGRLRQEVLGRQEEVMASLGMAEVGGRRPI